ncbi:enoyl-CoA hydratase/isomerase family protein [Pseudorhodoferax sp. Leaf274]|uniref:enoyl-CoA hydratase/isomerase family protein n=1 Tax=Pseudorhodoferax sp. Leaf274 TaxID=1736318 RepID=UPI0009EB536C|nr:enoyl-CoA hydratase-related protein [Pseudorhodoferax sp. Leaf274]
MRTVAEDTPLGGIHLHRQGPVAEVVIHLPSQKNSFRAGDVVRLGQLLDEVQAGDARCLLLRGGADVFSAGWDLSSLDMASADPMAVIGEVVSPFCKRLREFPLPTLSAVAGPALGFGLGLALACDLCIADEDALLGSPFRNIGFVPDTGAHHFLLERLGYHHAAELIYTGRLLSGQAAAEARLINRAVPAGTVVAEARKLAESIGSGPTQAFRLSKDILLRGGSFDEMLDREARHQASVFATADTAEGLQAFQQRRKPVFTGR